MHEKIKKAEKKLKSASAAMQKLEKVDIKQDKKMMEMKKKKACR